MIDFSLIAPEIVLAVGAMALLLASSFGQGAKTMNGTASGAVAVLALTGVLVARQNGADLTLGGMFGTDAFRRFLKILVLAASGASLLLAPSFFAKERETRAEYPVLILFATLGMMLLVSAQDLIALYVGLELQNLALYVLVSFRRDDRLASEAGLKYFTLGALSSAILLFGLSLLYGFTGETSFGAIQKFLAASASLPLGLVFGIALTWAGLAFKISAVPFHMWTPDVYEGAPAPVTTFLATAPKIAAFGLLACLPFSQAENLGQPLLIALSVASMAWGCFAGLGQTKIKRLMAYSAIVNSGTILIALVVQDRASLLVYLTVYALGTLGVLGCVTCLLRSGRPIEEISDLSGLSKTHPAWAVMMAVCLFSLAGVPPLAGFFGKLAVLMAAVKAGMVPLALFGVGASVVAAFYYLKIIKVMFFDEVRGLPLEPVSERIPFVLVGLVSAATVVFVLCPSVLSEAAGRVAGSLIFE